jgi:hypothetical protein
VLRYWTVLTSAVLCAGGACVISCPYLDDFLTADGKRFQDGATTANNPTVIALQQARLLHPQVSPEALCSLRC